MLTLQQALLAQQKHAANSVLTPADIEDILRGVSVTFAQIEYVTKVTTAAKHKAELIQKVTSANVTLCSNIKAHTDLYARMVRKSAARLNNNDTAVDNFTAQSNYFDHTACFSVVKHKVHEKFYLYAVFNKASSIYLHNGKQVSREYVAQYLTPAAAEKLLYDDGIVNNITHGIQHTVQVRTIGLENIVSIRARHRLLTI